MKKTIAHGNIIRCLYMEKAKLRLTFCNKIQSFAFLMFKSGNTYFMNFTFDSSRGFASGFSSG